MEVTFDVNLVRNKLLKAELDRLETAPCASECPLCGGRFIPFIRLVNAEGQAIVERSLCPECTFVTLTRIPTQEWFHSFYGKTWDQRRSDAQIETKLDNAYEELFEVVLPRLQSRDARIFEIGVGYGACLNQFKKKGYSHLYGIEASERRREYASGKLGLNVDLATSETMLQSETVNRGGPYDLVYSWHVIEHVYDLNRTMENASQLLKPDGLLFFAVPHFYEEHLFSLAHFLPHIHSFTRQSITTLLNKHGFEVIHIDDEIRVLARKTGHPLPKTPLPQKDHFFRSLTDKFERDLCLKEIGVKTPARKDLLFFFSSGKPQKAGFKKSRQWLIPLEKTSRKERALLGLQTAFGHGIRPLPSFNWRRPGSYRPKEMFLRGVNRYNTIVERLKKRRVDRDAQSWVYTIGGKTRVIRDSGVGTPIPTLDVCYPGKSVYAWLK